MGVQEIKVPVSIKTTVDGNGVKYVVFDVTIDNVTHTLVVKYSDNLYYAIKSRVMSEYFKAKQGEVLL